MATHSSILAGESLWTEEPGGLQSMGWQRVGHNNTLTGSVPMFRDSVGPWPDMLAILIESRKDITDLFLHAKKRPCEDMHKKQPPSSHQESTLETNPVGTWISDLSLQNFKKISCFLKSPSL